MSQRRLLKPSKNIIVFKGIFIRLFFKGKFKSEKFRVMENTVSGLRTRLTEPDELKYFEDFMTMILVNSGQKAMLQPFTAQMSEIREKMGFRETEKPRAGFSELGASDKDLHKFSSLEGRMKL